MAILYGLFVLKVDSEQSPSMGVRALDLKRLQADISRFIPKKLPLLFQ